MPEAEPGEEKMQQGELQKFSFETSVDVIWKLYWEIERLNHATPHDIIDMKCFAFNAAVTAWQLTDWIFEDMSDEQRRQFGISKLSDLQKMAREQCRALHLCRQIATASKHRVVKMKHYDDSVSTRIDFDRTDAYQWPKWGLMIIDGDKSYPAIAVFEEARLYWYKFLCGLGLIL
jgi:hypothetical protein